MVKKVLIFFIVWRLLLFLFAFAGTFLFEFDPTSTPQHFLPFLPYYFSVWANFDGLFYMTIAREGYHSVEYPFFPLFPLLIRLLHIIFNIRFRISGLIVSSISLIGSLFVMLKILKKDKKESLSLLFLAIVFIFPTSFYLTSVYNDSLFLLLASLTIYFARNKRWVTASIFGGLATLARLNGLALLPFICVEYLTQFYVDGRMKWNVRSMIKDKIYAFCLIPASFFGYLYYINHTYGSWTLVFTSMKAWNQDKITFPLQVFWRYFKILVIYPTFKLNYWIAMLEFASVFLFIGLLIYSFKKIRFSYWVFFAVSILIPSLTGTFQGMPRYGLHLYPFFLSLTLFFEKKDKRILFGYFTICMLLGLILVALFTRGYFVA